jgi:vacuolar-type H+-ATPase subunit F/Vma7
LSTPVYIGDEASAAGWRLAGVRVVVPEEGAEASALATALSHAPLVLLSSAVAARIPEDSLRTTQAALAPLTLIVPDLAGNVPVPDVAARLRHQLGLEG